MPTTSVYIRKEDWESWIATENKAELIHNALNDGLEYRSMPPVKMGILPPKVEHTVEAPVTNMERGCCLLPKPCVHWQHSGTDGAWVNSISGRVRETV